MPTNPTNPETTEYAEFTIPESLKNDPIYVEFLEQIEKNISVMTWDQLKNEYRCMATDSYQMALNDVENHSHHVELEAKYGIAMMVNNLIARAAIMVLNKTVDPHSKVIASEKSADPDNLTSHSIEIDHSGAFSHNPDACAGCKEHPMDAFEFTFFMATIKYKNAHEELRREVAKAEAAQAAKAGGTSQ